MALIYNNVNVPFTAPTGYSNAVLTTTGGSNGTSWTAPNNQFSSSTGNTILSIPFGEDKVILNETATLDVQGSVRINGIDLDERLKTIEKVLCIPQRDATLEAKHPKLKQLYEQYMHELEKYQTWERIKGTNDD